MTGHKKETLKEGYNTYYNRDKTNLALIYERYPYRKRTCKTCLPYVPSDADTDHKYSLTYQEWGEIIQCYFKYLCLYLLTGTRYRFSSGMGELQIQKYKSNKKNSAVDLGKMTKYYMEKEGIDDWQEAKRYIRDHVNNPKLFKHKNKHTLGYKWNIVWFKRGYDFAFKYHWWFRFSKEGAWRFIDNMFREDRELIYNIMESKFTVKNK